MKKAIMPLLWIIFIGTAINALAQDSNDLFKEGEALRGQGKFEEAMGKYKEALKADPENANASYNLGFLLIGQQKYEDAIPYLEKVTLSPHPGLVVSSYSLIGSAYDSDHQPQKAIEAYNTAIKLGPDFPGLFYNLGLVYFRNNQYAEAETAAIESLKKPRAGSGEQRLYALVCFHQNKRGNALLALCSYLLLDPAGPRSTEAYTNIQSILKGGVLKDSNGKPVIEVSGNDPEVAALNKEITTITTTAQAKKLQGNELLSYELKTFLTFAGQMAEKRADKSFVDKYFAAYLYKLSQSDQMDTFVQEVAASSNKDTATKWQQDNKEKANALKEWAKNTNREF